MLIFVSVIGVDIILDKEIREWLIVECLMCDMSDQSVFVRELG